MILITKDSVFISNDCELTLSGYVKSENAYHVLIFEIHEKKGSSIYCHSDKDIVLNVFDYIKSEIANGNTVIDLRKKIAEVER